MDRPVEHKTLTWDEFNHVGLHVGTVVSVIPFEEARSPAYIVHVDFGAYGVLKTSAQITDLFLPQDLVGRQVVGVLHFPDKQIGPHRSQFLLLGAHDEMRRVSVLSLDHKVPNGSPVH